MRTKTDITFVLDLDPAHILSALAAVEKMPEWSTAYRDVRVATRDEAGRPARVFVKVDLTGGSDLQVLEYEWTETRSAWTITDSSRGIKGRGWFEITEGEPTAGTEVWYHSELQLPLPVPGVLLKRGVRKNDEATVRNFIDFAEQYPEPENPEQYQIR